MSIQYIPCMMHTSIYTRKAILNSLDIIDCSPENSHFVHYNLSPSHSNWFDRNVSLSQPACESTQDACVSSDACPQCIPAYLRDAYEAIRQNFGYSSHREQLSSFLLFTQFNHLQSPSSSRGNAERLPSYYRYLDQKYNDCLCKKDNCCMCVTYDRLLQHGKDLASTYFSSEEYKHSKQTTLNMLQDIPLDEDILTHTVSSFLSGELVNIKNKDYLDLPTSEFMWSLMMEMSDGTIHDAGDIQHMLARDRNYLGVLLDFDLRCKSVYLRFGLKDQPIDFYRSPVFLVDPSTERTLREMDWHIQAIDWPQDV
jgi:hypothetical protein